MKLRVSPKDRLQGTIDIPGDKSISHRSVLISALAEGKSRIRGFLSAEDCMHTLQAVKALGIQVEMNGGNKELLIDGKGLNGLNEPEKVLYMGNSGTGTRLLVGILSGQDFFSVLSGDHSLRRRPMLRIVEPLRLMGAEISGRSNGQHLPLSITGKRQLSALHYQTPVASAQVKSAILLAGLFAEGETEVEEPGPSRDHTERMLQQFGAELTTGELKVKIEGGQMLHAADFSVPGDISSAAYFLAAGSMVPDSMIRMNNIGINPTRSGIIEVMKMMGADLKVDHLRTVSGEPTADLRVRTSQLRGVTVEGELIPRLIDEIPIISIMAAYAEGETVIRDAEELRVKESDRLSALAGAFKKMGVGVEELKDGLIIQGRAGAPFEGGSFHCFNDHRIALSLAVAGLVSRDGIEVAGSEFIETSFPDFPRLLESL